MSQPTSPANSAVNISHAVNTLFYGDNLDVLRQRAEASVDLIYLDPPFNSNRNYFVLFKDRGGQASAAQEEAFTDTWSWGEDAERAYKELLTDCPNQELSTTIGALRRVLKETPMMAYLVAMTIRLMEMHRALKPTGSLYLHCDPVASHFLKVCLDVIFGPLNFRNEITWKRTTAHGDARRKFADVNDTILFYSKSDQYTFHHQTTAYDADYIAREFSRVDEQGRRYALDNMASPSLRPNLIYAYKGFPSPRLGWRYSRETMEKLDNEGRLLFPAKAGGRIRLKRFLDEQKGMPVTNAWTDLPPVHVRSNERLGYPTQKPLALLERIIAASSNPGDVVMDPFCGCGTAVAAAQKLGRQWVGIDITAVAVGIIKSRLEDMFPELVGKVTVEGFPRDLESVRALFEASSHQFQIWANTLVGAFPLTKKGADAGIDGWRSFLDLDETPQRAVVQVKGGKVSVSQVRDFCHVVAREKATLGFFLCMGDEGRTVTGPMQNEALKEGFWTSAGGRDYARVQILTVKGLLARTEEPKLPPQDKRSTLGFKAKKETAKGQQTSAEDTLFDE